MKQKARAARAGAVLPLTGMGFFERLAGGVDGVRLALPDAFEPLQDFGESALAMGPEGAVGLHASFSNYRLVVDPLHEHLLRRDAERCARDLFNDPDGSPLVSLEVPDLCGRRAVESIHRMRDGLVLGHLLIPTATGCIELRPLSEGPEPVERVRELLSWLRAQVAIEGTLPAQNGASVGLVQLGCTVTVPPRYGLHRDGVELAQFSRLSLATTDGVLLLTLIRRGPRRDVTPAGLRKIGEQMASTTLPAEAAAAKLEAIGVVGPDGRQDVEVSLAFHLPDVPPRRDVFRVWADEVGEVWVAALSSAQSTPPDEASEELAGVVASFRRG